MSVSKNVSKNRANRPWLHVISYLRGSIQGTTARAALFSLPHIGHSRVEQDLSHSTHLACMPCMTGFYRYAERLSQGQRNLLLSDPLFELDQMACQYCRKLCIRIGQHTHK
ncbi:hypothetical protein BGZ46_004762, partial [Entomortierella lignicola]